jgi:hypothetical protein
MLNFFVEVGYVTGPIPAGGVVEGSAQDKGELGATMTMLWHDPPGRHFQQPERTAALHGEPMVPYAEPKPAPSHSGEAAGQEPRERRCRLHWPCAFVASLLGRGQALARGRFGLCAVHAYGRECGEQGRADPLERGHFAATACAHGNMSRRHCRECRREGAGSETQQRRVIEVVRDAHRKSSSAVRIFW